MTRFGFKRFICAAVLALAALSVQAVAGSKPLSAPLKITATTGMIADAAQIIAGDQAEVRALMGPGVDPHGYRPVRSDIVALAQADLALSHGLHLEAQMGDLLAEIGAKRGTHIAVADSLPKEKLIAHTIYHDKSDPHLWMDPVLWSSVVVNIRDALMNARPEAAAQFRANTDLYLQDLAQLDARSKAALQRVPQNSRVLLTAHDAFQYFGAAYEFEVIGIQGISTESEAGLQRIAALVDLLVARDIRAVFVETSVSDRNIRAVIEGARALGHDVVIGGELFSDSMGAAGTPEGSYLGMIEHNVSTIAEALGASDALVAQGLVN